MNNEYNPVISIIVAVFNGAKTLQQCIESVASQTYPYKELIVIDGGSKDGTVDILKNNCQWIRYWISEPDRGICNAWNKGLAKAKGEWICFLGADDYLWDSQVLERASGQLAKLPSSICVAYGRVTIVNSCGENLYLIGEEWWKIKKRFMQSMCISHQGVIHRRSLYEQHGYYDESYRIAGDYELLLRELKTNDAYFIQDVIISAMRDSGASWAVANSLLVICENRRAAKAHGKSFPSWLWLLEILKAYIKLMLWGVLGERASRKVLNYYWRITGLQSY
jgi:glycosyltransferase involved in cell wall biosynthesis